MTLSSSFQSCSYHFHIQDWKIPQYVSRYVYKHILLSSCSKAAKEWSYHFSGLTSKRQSSSTGVFNPGTFTNNLPFTNNGPYAVPTYLQQQPGSNVNQSQNSTQAGVQPFNSQPANGQMSTAGFSFGQQLPGSGVSSGQMSSAGFVSGNPVPSGSMQGSQTNGSSASSSPVSGYTGSNISPFSSQTGNNSMSVAGYSSSGQFNPSLMNSMTGNFSNMQNTFNPAQFMGRSKFASI